MLAKTSSDDRSNALYFLIALSTLIADMHKNAVKNIQQILIIYIVQKQLEYATITTKIFWCR